MNKQKQIENLQVIIAWLAEEITEGIAAKMIGVDRLALRKMRDDAIAAAQPLCAAGGLHDWVDCIIPDTAEECSKCGIRR